MEGADLGEGVLHSQNPSTYGPKSTTLIPNSPNLTQPSGQGPATHHTLPLHECEGSAQPLTSKRVGQLCESHAGQTGPSGALGRRKVPAASPRSPVAGRPESREQERGKVRVGGRRC